MNKQITLFGGSLMLIFLMIPCLSLANSLDVEFSGVLIRSSCQVTTESINKKVQLNNLRKKFINENQQSEVTPFYIGIEKCSPVDLYKMIKFTWQSNQLVMIDGQSYLLTQGSSNAVLGLVNRDGDPIIWNAARKVGSVSIIDSEQRLAFGAFIRKPASGEVKEGDFSTQVTFAVEYE
ncbi:MULTISPECIES: fimbrial protein [Providencia]|uniref:fimbrial protein n=1 Tax=Providencia TaxID=586 RepID=UPI0009EE3801|nr:MULTISPECIES: fimbrial protein [Providencia]MBP6123979.1 type 1 fimbrial protein [Providencia sp.]NIH21204.1 type 1 fimbrial protein [Providencia heimbachae]